MFYKLPYPILQRLRLDLAGEWRDDNKEFRKACADLGIDLEYSSPQDKRSAAHAEAAIKHLVVPAKAQLYHAALPPEWIEECM